MSYKIWFQRGLAIVASIAILLTGCQPQNSSDVLASQSGAQVDTESQEATVYRIAERLSEASAHYNKITAAELLRDRQLILYGYTKGDVTEPEQE